MDIEDINDETNKDINFLEMVLQKQFTEKEKEELTYALSINFNKLLLKLMSRNMYKQMIIYKLYKGYGDINGKS